MKYKLYCFFLFLLKTLEFLFKNLFFFFFCLPAGVSEALALMGLTFINSNGKEKSRLLSIEYQTLLASSFN